MLIVNARILTAAESDPWFPDGVIAIRADRIVWIGSRADWLRSPMAAEWAIDTRLDLGGALVLPGLINAHSHAGLSTLRGLCDDGDLFEWARKIGPWTGALTDDAMRRGCDLAVREHLANGITCTCDCARYDPGTFIESAHRYGLRTLSGCLASDPALRPGPRRNWPDAIAWTHVAMERWAGDPLVRLFLGAHSPYNCSDEVVRRVKGVCDEWGIDFVMHVAESRVEVERSLAEYGETPVERLARLGALDERSLLVHAVWLSDQDLDILAERRVRIAHCPTSNAKLASGIAPIAALRARGLAVGLGTDSMLSQNSQNLLEEAKWSVLLQRLRAADGSVLGAADGFAMATREGAAALAWQTDIGSLEPGKLADIVVLDRPPTRGDGADDAMSDIVFASGPRDVRMTIVGGRVSYEQGRYPLGEASAAASEAG